MQGKKIPEYTTYPGSDRQYKAIRLECSQCHSAFLKRETKNKTEGLHFCSSECISKSKSVELECAVCQTKFQRLKSNLGKSRHGIYFCSRECKDFGQSIDDGVLEIQPDHYTKVENADAWSKNTYRKYALREQGSECRLCGYNEYEEALEVHHNDGDRSNNSKDNLTVLCAICHKLVEF